VNPTGSKSPSWIRGWYSAGEFDPHLQHGFTTRKDGHGSGLHSGALAGEGNERLLTVHSDGPGQGATFTLELPCPDEEEHT